jgi:antitoxin VapB
MSFLIEDEETDALVREVARRRGEEVAETIKAVFGAELKREEEKLPLYERIKHLQIKGVGHLNLSTDKAFFDSLNDEED